METQDVKPPTGHKIFIAGLLGGGAVVLATGIYLVIALPGWEEFGKPIATLANDSNFKETYKDKWAAKNARFLLNPQGEENRYLWDKKYESFKHYRPNKGKFKGVTEAFGDREDSLSKVCDDAYKSGSDKVVGGTVNDNEDKFKEGEVWAFCSIVEKKIETISWFKTANASDQTNYSSGTYGEKQEYKDNLVWTKLSDKNYKYWSLQEEALKREKQWTGKKNNKFKLLSERLKYPSQDDENQGLTERKLRDLCESAYNSTIPDDSDVDPEYPKKEVFKFCSITGEEPSSTTT